MSHPGYEVESVPIERSMPVALKSSRGVDKQACTEAVVVQETARILLANLLQRSRSTFSWGSFLSFFAFQADMLSTPISVLGG